MFRVSKLWQLSRHERGSLVRGLWCLPLLALALRFYGWRRCRQWLEQRAGRLPAVVVDELAYAQQTARIVHLAGRYSVVKARCLPQSLLLWYWLRQAGLDSELCFGAHKAAGTLEAHAWVEYQGVPLAEAVNVRQYSVPFTPVASGL